MKLFASFFLLTFAFAPMTVFGQLAKNMIENKVLPREDMLSNNPERYIGTDAVDTLINNIYRYRSRLPDSEFWWDFANVFVKDEDGKYIQQSRYYFRWDSNQLSHVLGFLKYEVDNDSETVPTNAEVRIAQTNGYDQYNYSNWSELEWLEGSMTEHRFKTSATDTSLNASFYKRIGDKQYVFTSRLEEYSSEDSISVLLYDSTNTLNNPSRYTKNVSVAGADVESVSNYIFDDGGWKTRDSTVTLRINDTLTVIHSFGRLNHTNGVVLITIDTVTVYKDTIWTHQYELYSSSELMSFSTQHTNGDTVIVQKETTIVYKDSGKQRRFLFTRNKYLNGRFYSSYIDRPAIITAINGDSSWIDPDYTDRYFTRWEYDDQDRLIHFEKKESRRWGYLPNVTNRWLEYFPNGMLKKEKYELSVIDPFFTEQSDPFRTIVKENFLDETESIIDSVTIVDVGDYWNYLPERFHPADTTYIKFTSTTSAKTEFPIPVWSSISEQQDVSVPNNIELRNFPNPFNPNTTIQFSLTKPEDVSIEIFDVMGRKVATIARGFFSVGKHEFTFFAEDLSSGIYLITLRTKTERINHKIMLLK